MARSVNALDRIRHQLETDRKGVVVKIQAQIDGMKAKTVGDWKMHMDNAMQCIGFM